MEFKSLVLGLCLSVGAFALKAGAGLGYVLADGRPLPVQGLRCAGFAGIYGLVFAASAWIIGHVDLTAHLATLSLWFKSGMTLHLILAVLVMAWGVGLVKSGPPGRHKPEKRSRTWLALVLPCPVCVSVILLSGGFLRTLYPGEVLVWLWFYGGFVILALTAAVTVSRLARGRAETVLGSLMIYISGYFILMVLLVPQWADLGRIYRLGLTAGTGVSNPWSGGLAVILVSAAAFCLGFFRAHTKEDV